MSKTEQPIGSSDTTDAKDTMRRERLARGDLEAKVDDLERQLQVERAKLQRISSRKSVRLALKTAALGRQLLGALRRRGRRPIKADSTVSAQAEVSASICLHRNDSGPESGPWVTIVVLNRDGEQHLERLLPSLRDNTTYRSFELVVVDNGSTDKSMDLLNVDWGFPLQTVRNEENVSFSRGCNQGIAVATGPYVMLLNNDITPINPGWLGALVTSLEDDPYRGAAGTLLVYPDRAGYVSSDPNTGADLTIQHRGISFRWRRNAEPSATVPWAYNMGVGEDPTGPDLTATVEVPAATAACLLVRRDLLDQLGGLDEGFMYGMEDVDLSLRIRTAGFSVVIVGAAALYHHEFGTQSVVAAARRRANGLANLKHFSEKWAPLLSRLLQLESLLPEPQRLRHRPAPVVAITLSRNDPELNEGDWSAAHELGADLAAAGYLVAYAERYEDRWYDLDSGVVTVISLLNDYDVRRAPPDATTIAWIADRADQWTVHPWFGMYDFYIPGNQPMAETLAAAGATVTGVVPLASDQAKLMAASVRKLVLRPRIALRSIETGESGRREANFTADLATALRRKGAHPMVQELDEWETSAAQCVDIAIQRGVSSYRPKPAHKNIIWIIDPTAQVTRRDC
ncbi:MAG: glycosyltransferase family 2 protein, partial [bacterium]|nr:glycosyltransferase family 2 protein [bacterium]